MTSLIDVIFLLLLFFMLSSTFSRFAEIELSAAGGRSVSETDAAMIFLRLGPETLGVNGRPTDLPTLSETIQSYMETETAQALVSLSGPVDAQRLTDLLVALNGINGLDVAVMDPS
ncbi:biopolymer transporter ExbD [Thalassococcus sp. S3]|nr:biopolymer transporter ExbD [Thalassococcus sp. S3]